MLGPGYTERPLLVLGCGCLWSEHLESWCILLGTKMQPFLGLGHVVGYLYRDLSFGTELQLPLGWGHLEGWLFSYPLLSAELQVPLRWNKLWATYVATPPLGLRCSHLLGGLP